MSRRRARAVRVFAVLCFLVAGLGAATLPAMLVRPEWRSFVLDCENDCRPRPAPLDQLSPEARHEMADMPKVEERMIAAMSVPHWWWRLLGIQCLNAGPFVLLFFSVAMALWRFGDREEHRDWSGIRWLQRAAAAGLALAITDPLTECLRDAVFMAAVMDVHEISYAIEFVDLLDRLLVAGAAWAATWALAAGLRARGELAEIV